MNQGMISGIISKDSLRFFPEGDQAPKVLKFNIAFYTYNAKKEKEYSFFQCRFFGENRISSLLKQGINEGDQIVCTYALANEKYKSNEGKNIVNNVLNVIELYKVGEKYHQNDASNGNFATPKPNSNVMPSQEEDSFSSRYYVDENDMPF